MTTYDKIILLERLIEHFNSYEPWFNNTKLCDHYCRAVEKYGLITGKNKQTYSPIKKHTVAINYFDYETETFTGTIKEIVYHINNYYKRHDSDSVYTNAECDKIIATAGNTGVISIPASYETASMFHNWGECTIYLDKYAEYVDHVKMAHYIMKQNH